jgi:hypothetical protein
VSSLDAAPALRIEGGTEIGSFAVTREAGSAFVLADRFGDQVQHARAAPPVAPGSDQLLATGLSGSCAVARDAEKIADIALRLTTASRVSDGNSS